MIPTHDQITALHRKYAPNDMLYKLVFDHCRAVAEIAVWCAGRLPENQVDTKLLESAALLHDIGAYGFIDESDGHIANHHTYAQHAILGAEILRGEGVDEQIVQIVRTHVQLGWTKTEIENLHLALPPENLMPQTKEAEILCYADRYHSKMPRFNSYDGYVKFLQKIFPMQLDKFQVAAKAYGIPDIEALAKKYGHPVV